jgi:hypothetical protein
MKIYLVQRPDEKIDWDEYKGAVVIAESPDEALKMLHKEHDSLSWNESWGDWDVTITEINLATPAIVLESYNAG